MWRLIKYLAITLVGLVILAVFLNFRSLLALKRIYNASLAGKSNIEQTVNLVQQNKLPQALEYARLAHNNFQEALEQLAIVDNNFFVQRISTLRGQVQDVEYLLKTAEILSRSVDQGVTVVQKISGVFSGQLGTSFTEFKPEEKLAMLRLIYEATPDLNGIKANLNLSLLNLRKVQGGGFLKPFQDKINLARQQLELGVGLMDKAIVLSELLPVLAGYPEAVNYLVVLQNNDELRPTGGFVGTLGVLEIYLGDLTKFHTHDAYHLDMPASLEKSFKVTPPWPLQKYLGVDNWYLRDANWSPDWPQSAQKIEWFYRTEAQYNKEPEIFQVPKFAGVIAITPQLITDLLGLVGPVWAAGIEYNQNNFTEVLQYEVEMAYHEKGISQWDRKKIIGDIIRELKVKLMDLPTSRYLELISVLEKNIQKKNLLLYFNDPQIQVLTKIWQWSGEIKAAPLDYLMVVDSNLAAYKTDRVMDKTITYTLEEREDGLYAQTRIDYKHNGSFDWKTTRYRSYVRLLAPLGSQFIKADGLSEGGVEVKDEEYSNPEANKTVFGGFISIEPGHDGFVEFFYKLPRGFSERLNNSFYNLYIQRQGGSRIKELKLNLKFKKPVRSAYPIDFSINKNGLSEFKWSTNLETDRFLELGF